MRDYDCEDFIPENGGSEPLIYVGDGDDLPLVDNGLEDYDEKSTRAWTDFVHAKRSVQDRTQSSPRLRHGFLLDTPNPLCSSPPDLPLYSPDGGSPRCHTPQHFTVNTHTLLNTNGPSSPSTAIFGYYTRLSPLLNSQFAWLSLYFSLNLLLTLSNKSVLTTFPFPYTLTALHALFSTLGGNWLRWRGAYTPKHLSRRNELVLVGFSVLYAINIAVSNISLNLVTVPFHQVIRALTPIFTVALSSVFFNTHFGRQKMIPLAPVMMGVALATYGDYYFTAWGFCLTLIGTFLAAMKTIFTNVLQSAPKMNLTPPPSRETTFSHASSKFSLDSTLIGTLVSCMQHLLPPSLELHPLDLLTRMSPLAFVQCVLYAQMSGELDKVRQYSASGGFPMQPIGGLSLPHGLDLAKVLLLVINGCIAFGLNVVSFFANGKVGPLSMTVAANVKQVLTILFAVSLFDLTITPMNALGISITLLGGAWYAWEEYHAKSRRARRTAQPQ